MHLRRGATVYIGFIALKQRVVVNSCGHENNLLASKTQKGTVIY
jgi:hypothetical protein